MLDARNPAQSLRGSPAPGGCAAGLCCSSSARWGQAPPQAHRLPGGPGHLQRPAFPPVPSLSPPADAPLNPWRMFLSAQDPASLLCLETTGSCPAHLTLPGRLPLLPSHPWGPRGASTHTAPTKNASPSPVSWTPPRSVSRAAFTTGLCTGVAQPFFLFIPFSLPECALLALAARAGRAPLPPRSRGSPQQMGPGCECAHSEAPKRICWCPFHCEPLCAAPLRWDAPEFSPGFSPFHSRRKENAYKGLVCPTCLRGPYCCRCCGSWRDSVAPLRTGDVRLPPGRV